MPIISQEDRDGEPIPKNPASYIIPDFKYFGRPASLVNVSISIIITF